MRIAVSSSLWGLALFPCLGYALPATTSGADRLIESNTSIPTPIIATELQGHHKLKGVYVYLIGVSEDGAADQRSTFFGNANDQIALVCDELTQIPKLVDPQLNPSGKIDAVGFSQGGQLLRGLVERCSELKFRSLITLGSQHVSSVSETGSTLKGDCLDQSTDPVLFLSFQMGISSLPPCPPGSSPFSTCHLFHLALLKNGLYSSWAQQNLLPAQYVRDEARIEDYLKVNVFLKDINNEREGDREVGPPKGGEVIGLRGRDEGERRNQTYKKNFARLEKLVLLRFSMDTTVVPPHTAHFTLPSPTASRCPIPLDPTCYVDPVEWADLPLYQDDYIGLKQLDARGLVWKGVCKGAHMEIDRRCWSTVTRFLVGNGEKEGDEDVRDNAFVLQG